MLPELSTAVVAELPPSCSLAFQSTAHIRGLCPRRRRKPTTIDGGDLDERLAVIAAGINEPVIAKEA